MPEYIGTLDRDGFAILEVRLGKVASGDVSIDVMNYIQDVGQALATIRAREGTVKLLCDDRQQEHNHVTRLRFLLGRAQRQIRAKRISAGLATIKQALEE